MSDVIFWTIMSLLAVALIYGCIFWIPYSTHISMTKSHGSNWGYGTFEQFVEHFNRVEKEYGWSTHGWSSSLFAHSNGGEKGHLHASVVSFDAKGMVMKSSIDYIRTHRFIRHYIKNGKLTERVEW